MPTGFSSSLAFNYEKSQNWQHTRIKLNVIKNRPTRYEAAPISHASHQLTGRRFLSVFWVFIGIAGGVNGFRSASWSREKSMDEWVGSGWKVVGNEHFMKSNMARFLFCLSIFEIFTQTSKANKKKEEENAIQSCLLAVCFLLQRVCSSATFAWHSTIVLFHYRVVCCTRNEMRQNVMFFAILIRLCLSHGSRAASRCRLLSLETFIGWRYWRQQFARSNDQCNVPRWPTSKEVDNRPNFEWP